MDIPAQDLAAIETRIANWLIGPARRSCTPAEIVDGLVERLVAAGIALWRVGSPPPVGKPMLCFQG